MMARVADPDRFRRAISHRLGLHFEDDKLDFLREVLQRRLDCLDCPGDAYLTSLENEEARQEQAELARELTITETYFFRNNDQFRALAEVGLPSRMAAHPDEPVLRMLSAGCASGEEPYTMAIIAREAIAGTSWQVRIRAVDLNPAALDKAAKGRYSAWALRETPEEMRHRWFRKDGDALLLDEAIRRPVRLELRNLVAGDPDLWPPATYDVIFCRNVLMYFSPEHMRRTVASIAHALAPGGFLFLGHAETLRGLSDHFHLRHTHDTFYYERKSGSEETIRPPLRPAPPPPPGGSGAAWFEVIGLATARVAALLPHPPPNSQKEKTPQPVWDLHHAYELMHRECYAEALAYLQDGNGAASEDPDIMLLHAVLLAQAGMTAEAEEACHRLLARKDTDAAGHYVLALCREAAGDLAEALGYYRIAVELAPDFALARLHHGLAASRAGDLGAARRELRAARAQIEREDTARLLMFGGGFSRASLIALCDSALRDCGDRP